MKKSVTDHVLVSAIFLVLLFSVVILINLLFGFNLGLYLLVALCALVLCFLFPVSGLLAMTFLILIWSQNFTLSPLIINQVEYKFYLIDIFLVSIYFRTALDWLKYRRPALGVLDNILILFFVWVGLIFWFSLAFWDASLQPAFSSLKNYTFYPALFFVIWYWFRDRQIFKLWLGFFMSGAGLSLGFFVYGLIAGQGLWTDITPLSTSGSRFLDFNHAFYLCLAFILGLSQIIWQKDKLSKVLVWLLPLFLVAVAGSLMRHLWLALGVYLLWLVITLGNGRASLKLLVTKYLAAGIMFFALILFIFNLLPQSNLSQQVGQQQGYFVTRLSSLLDDGDTSIAWRGTLWQVVWDNYLVNPLVGQGLGQKVFIDMGDYKDYVELRNVHNSFLAVLTQVGLVGFLLFAIFTVGQLIKIWRHRVKDNLSQMMRYSFGGIIIFCSVAFLFQPYLEANFFSLWWWMFLGLGHAYYEGAFS